MTVGTLRELSHSGDTTITWNSENEDEIDVARQAFARLKDKGYLAYRTQDGERGEVIRSFDPDAEAIIMSPQLVGG